jgi:carboxyl-terminal processing protease
MLSDPNTEQRTPSVPPDPDEEYRRYRYMRQRYAGQDLSQLITTAVLVIVAFAAGWFGNLAVNRANYVPPDSEEHLIIQAWNAINDNYAVTSSLDQKKMAYAAIDAMVQSLGDTGHSRFETPEEAKAEQDSLNNNPNVGIGIYLSGGGDQPIRIDAVLPNSPGAKAGLKAGDLILAVNGTSVKGKTIDQMKQLVGHTKGTVVTLGIQRGTGKTVQMLSIKVTLNEYTSPIVVSYIIPELNIADIQILQFAQGTDKELKKALDEAKAHNVRGIVLDLRDNPGGYLDEAVKVASEFVPNAQSKTILVTRSRTDRTVEKGVSGGRATDIPLTILVNNNTASAAEIVAGAININRPEATVIGETTFGTGTVLQSFKLSDGSVIWLGTQEWLLPNGQSIYHKGYTPEQQVKLPNGQVPVSPLVASQEDMTLPQIVQANDTQLLRALDDLTGRQLEKPAA